MKTYPYRITITEQHAYTFDVVAESLEAAADVAMAKLERLGAEGFDALARGADAHRVTEPTISSAQRTPGG